MLSMKPELNSTTTNPLPKHHHDQDDIVTSTTNILTNNIKKVTATLEEAMTAPATTNDIENQSEIVKFYDGKDILITGATGFIGKVLIEKLLYTCPNIGNIYVLIRGSKGKSPKDRVWEMIQRKPFTFRLKKEIICNKIIPIESDLIQLKLGLNSNDLEKLRENVDIVFHVAASVKFEAPLEYNMLNNCVATKELLEISSTFNHLKCFVHVSTAYSNCQLNSVGELIYPMEMPSDGNLLDFKVTNEMIDNRPNTYTYTKGLAENIVCQYSNKMNIAIARPSIVTPSVMEPAQGWTDSLNGPVGLSLMGSLGILQKIRVNTEVVFDMIPVDIVSNALVTIAWAVTEKKDQFSNGNNLINLKQSPTSLSTPTDAVTTTYDYNENDTTNDSYQKGVNVFNLTTGNDNPCSFYEYFSKGRKYAKLNPSSRVLRPILEIPKQKGMNMLSYTLHKIFSHLLFAYIIDTLLSLFGQKKMLVKAVNRMHHANELFDYFTSHQWKFVTSNVQKLTHLQASFDKDNFNLDVKSIDWDQYSLIGWLGCRRYILKEDDKTVESARQRYKRVCFFYYALRVFLALVLTITIMNCSSSLLVSSFMIIPSLLVVYLL